MSLLHDLPMVYNMPVMSRQSQLCCVVLCYTSSIVVMSVAAVHAWRRCGKVLPGQACVHCLQICIRCSYQVSWTMCPQLWC